ncbi:fimbrial protein, partial [Cronobacter sakazakii]|uniref:fimbrial protein n=1 Tax=Cronobacter sakazakii TaxID=28141 RepID=UPI001ED8C002
MKKIVIAAGFAAIASMSATSAMAFDGTVKFTGEILDQACTVDIGTDNTLTVDLGKVSKTAFTGVGTDASTTKFTIKLKDCLKWFTEFGHLNRGDMLTSEQYR